MREMKDSGIEWIGAIPKDWKLTQARRLFNNKLKLPTHKVGVVP